MSAKTVDSLPSVKIFLFALVGVAISFMGAVLMIIGTFISTNELPLRIFFGVVAIIASTATVYFSRQALNAI